MSSFPPKKMVNRRQRSKIKPSPSKNELSFKLKRLASRHEQMKIAYRELKSQINTGLLEAEEVFASLAIPLIKLVGLKTKEMAEDGRFTTIIIDNQFSQGIRRNGVESGSPDTTTGRERDYRIGTLEEVQRKSYATRATIAGKEHMEKQKTNLLQLVHLLRQIETQVNYHQDEIFDALDSHRATLHKFFQKAIYCISSLHSKNHDIFIITVKLLHALFNNMNSILGSVEGGVQKLMQELAEKMCNPMVEYVKGLKDDMNNGTCVRLLALVKEMERMMRDGRLELEDARKKAEVAEQGKVEAICKLKMIKESAKGMKEQFSLLEPGVIETSTQQKLLGMEGEQAKDDKLLWKLLKRKRKLQAPASPIGPEGLVCFDANKRHKNLVGVKLSLENRQSTRGFKKRLGPITPYSNTCIPLGSSPSVAIQPAFSHK